MSVRDAVFWCSYFVDSQGFTIVSACVERLAALTQAIELDTHIKFSIKRFKVQLRRAGRTPQWVRDLPLAR